MIHTLHHRWHKKLSFALVLVFAAHLTTSGTAHAGVQVLINGEVTYDAGTCGNVGPTPSEFETKAYVVDLSQFERAFDGNDFRLFRISCPSNLACNDFNQRAFPTTMIPAAGSAELRWHHGTDAAGDAIIQPIRQDREQHFGYESATATFPEHWLSGHYVLGDDSTNCGVAPLQQYIVDPNKNGRYRWTVATSPQGSTKVAMAQPLAQSSSDKDTIGILISTREGREQQHQLYVSTWVADSLPPPFKPVGAPADDPPLRVNELREGAGYLGGNEEGYNGPVAQLVNRQQATTNSPFEVVLSKQWPVVILETRWDTSNGREPWSARVFSAHTLDWSDQENVELGKDSGGDKETAAGNQLALLIGSAALAVGALALLRTFGRRSASSTSGPA